MTFENILSEIDGQIARLQQAKALLSGGGHYIWKAQAGAAQVDRLPQHCCPDAEEAGSQCSG